MASQEQQKRVAVAKAWGMVNESAPGHTFKADKDSSGPLTKVTHPAHPGVEAHIHHPPLPASINHPLPDVAQTAPGTTLVANGQNSATELRRGDERLLAAAVNTKFGPAAALGRIEEFQDQMREAFESQGLKFFAHMKTLEEPARRKAKYAQTQREQAELAKRRQEGGDAA